MNLIELEKITAHFPIEDKCTDIKSLDAGLINDTYRICTEGENTPDYALQRINHTIFQNVEMLQSNIEKVTNRIRKQLEKRHEEDIDRKVLKFLTADNGKSYYFDGKNYWRIMLFIPRSQTHEIVNPKYSYCAGQAFGEFQVMLADIANELGETLPNFHNMEYRLQQLHEAVAADNVGRVASVEYYLTEIERRAEEMCKAERLHREGKLPKRVCHCDTKVNNLLFGEDGQVLCVIDLDTVMPNYIFSDFGDFMRTAANTGNEDDEDLNKVSFNMEIFKAFTKGYLEKASFLTPIEIENLPYAAALFPYMQTVRFLTDYINGDIYYKTKYPLHNLVRTKAQFKLLQSVEEHMPEMTTFIQECLSNNNLMNN